jgi:hypothetical protein
MKSLDYHLQLIGSKFPYQDCARGVLGLFNKFEVVSKGFICEGVIACIISFVFSLIFGKLLNQSLARFLPIIVALITIAVNTAANIPSFQA